MVETKKEVAKTPKNWKIVELQKYAQLINGRAYSLFEWEKHGVPVIRLQNLTGSGENYYYSNLKLPEKNYCSFGDLLYMWSATFGPIIWKGEKAIFHYHIWKIETLASLDKIYLYHKLEEITEKLKSTVSNGGTMLHITKAFMDSLQIPLPPLPEQQAIAKVLSDTDTWIESLEKLIAKKRLIKQGAMQELLTPKEGWEEFRLDYYGYFTSGNGFPLIFQGRKNGQFPFYKVSDFNNIGNELFMIDANNYISKEIADKLNCNIIKEGSIILAKIGAAIFLERKKQTTCPCCIDNNMMSYTVYEEKGDAKYFVYVLQSIQLGSLVTATALPSLSGKQVGAIVRKHPGKAEQTRIATILSDMDAEIEALENKLAKARQIKQGMMQELLTGRVRLVD